VNGRRIGTALVNGDFLRYVVQPDCLLEEASCCSVIAFGREQEVHGVSTTSRLWRDNLTSLKRKSIPI
jgi:hypothetical protein